MLSPTSLSCGIFFILPAGPLIFGLIDIENEFDNDWDLIY